MGGIEPVRITTRTLTPPKKSPAEFGGLHNMYTGLSDTNGPYEGFNILLEKQNDNGLLEIWSSRSRVKLYRDDRSALFQFDSAERFEGIGPEQLSGDWLSHRVVC